MRLAGLAVAIAAVAGLGLLLSPYNLSLLVLVGTFAVAALAQNLLSGYADLPSLGNVAFFATSSYTAAALLSVYRLPAAICFALGVSASAGLGLLIGLPALRVSGMHLGIVTVAVVFVAQEVTTQWDLVHGQNGVTVAQPGWLLDDRALYLAAAVTAGLSFLAVRNLLHSRSGRAVLAVADNPYAAAASGIDSMRYRLSVFVLSGTLTGAAGILYLYRAQTVTPQTFTLDLSLAFLTMMIVGGSRSLTGSLVGAAIIALLPNALGYVPAQIGTLNLAQSTPGINALLLLAVLWLFPAGLWNGLAGWDRLRRAEPSAQDVGIVTE